MTRIEELNSSQEISLSQDFYDCVSKGIIFNPEIGTDVLECCHMSANIIIHHWNHAKFLPMLFQSFECMNSAGIDFEIIITDSGSDEKNKNNVLKLLEKHKSDQNLFTPLKITYLIHDLDELRKEFNDKNLDGTFHGFPYISNSALKYCNKDIHVICDSSNIVNKNWLKGLCSPHYIFHKSKIIVKANGGDFTADSTLLLEEKDFLEEYLEYPHTYYGFGAGRGFGWSIKTTEIKRLGGFNQIFSCCGAVDDDLIYRAKLDGFQFIGHNKSLGLHRIHNEGYEQNTRKPNWGYKKLKELHQNTEIVCNTNTEIIPIEIYKNF